jgi:hypothetical protein
MFKINSSNGVITLSPKQLVEMLVARSIDSKQDPKVLASIPLVADALASNLEAQSLFKDTTPKSLLALGVSVGYYLNTFFRKNQIELTEETNAEKSD